MPALYLRLLGDAWAALSPPVQRLHAGPQTIRARGLFCVTYPGGALACAIGRIAGMPPACAETKIRLTVERQEEGEKWVRHFGEHLFVTWQEEGTGAILVERHGLIELRFRLSAPEGTLQYRQVGAGIRAGRIRLPLPRWLAPSIRSGEACDEAGRVTVLVQVALPILGEWLRYSGWISPEEGEP